MIKYEGKAVAIADALTQSEVLERHGALLYLKGMNSFFCQELYHDWDNIGYLAELLCIIDLLITSRDILLNSQMEPCHVIVYKVSGTEEHPKTLVIVPFLP